MQPAEFTAVRASLGLSVRGLAAALDVDPKTITRWANGTTPIPRTTTLALAELGRQQKEQAAVNFNFRRTIHSARPDGQGREEFTLDYETDSPPHCTTCGGNVTIENGIITCTGYPSGSTPARRAGCGASSRTMMRGQVFFAVVPDDGIPTTRER